MRITQRQLRQIIREELSRSIREQDETAQDVVALPPEPKKRGIFGPRPPSAEESAWNMSWEDLSQGEQDTLVAAVKNDPKFPTIVGTAVRNKDFDIKRFTNFLKKPYPQGGSKVFESLVGGSTARGLPIGKVLGNLARNFSNNEDRAARLGRLGISVVSGEGTNLDRLVYENAYLVAALEQIFVGEGFYHDEFRGGLKVPRRSEAPHLVEFVTAALGQGG